MANDAARDKQDKLHTSLREGAKRFRYAFIYGCGPEKAGIIINDTIRAAQQIDPANTLQQKFFGAATHPSTPALAKAGKRALNKFEDATPGLRELRACLKAYARKHEWLPGLDKRRVPVRKLHSALNFIITSSEAMRDQDGFYHFLGRADDLVKVSGQWVYPLEVELCVTDHPLVRECAVLALEMADRRMTLQAYVVLNEPSENKAETAALLKDYVKKKLLPYKYPRAHCRLSRQPPENRYREDRPTGAQSSDLSNIPRVTCM